MYAHYFILLIQSTETELGLILLLLCATRNKYIMHRVKERHF
jgi:hypothetical protein